MAYIEIGPKLGEQVVLVHGFADNILIWWPAMSALHRQDPTLHIFAVDMRGHGASSMPPAKRCAPSPEACFRVTDFADDIAAFIVRKHLHNVTLAGHSLGSFTVQQVALSHPELIARVVLVATSTKVSFPAEFDPPWMSTWSKTLEANGYKSKRDFYMLTPNDVGPDAIRYIKNYLTADAAAEPSLVAAYAPTTMRVRMGTWIGAFQAVEDFDSNGRLRELAVPALAMWGTQDLFLPAADQARVREELKAAALAHTTTSYWKQYGVLTISKITDPQTDIAHNVQWDAPQTVAADIDAFIRTGAPTQDLVHSDAAPNISRMIVEPGRATVVRLGQ